MTDSEKFTWDDDTVVIEQVDAIAVYTNPKGHIVIRQQGQYGDDDAWIVVPRNRVPELLKAISAETELGDLKQVV
jgi:hypothetical protein